MKPGETFLMMTHVNARDTDLFPFIVEVLEINSHGVLVRDRKMRKWMAEPDTLMPVIR